MTGLRDRKKQAARHRIIQVAGSLFASHGLEATTMEDIAEGAEVSVGTVYNYFGSKTALLVAGVDEDTAAMVDAGSSVLARPGTNPIKAVQRLVGVYVTHLTAWDPALLREVMAASFQRTGGDEVTAELARLDERLIEQMALLVSGFQERGRLRSDVDPMDATLLLFSALVTQLFMFLAIDGVDTPMLTDRINRQIELAFSGLQGS